ncbi:MAG: DUF4163 domain-containing protein [Lachnospiraceae bacterium]|nr:DUF4163 domain-containing protein [Lachnospiraceae bacterium]
MNIKKLYLTGMLLSLVFALQGCKENKEIKKPNNDIAKESSIETEPENINNNDTTYTIKTKSIVTNNIHVSYPQIIGLGNAEIQNKWNNIIKNKVDAGINNIGTKDSYVLSYKVKTQNEKVISLLMIGETATASTDYDKYTFKYTFNIDIETGESIRLKDSVDTEKVASQLLKGNNYSVKDAQDSVFREYLTLFYKNTKQLCEDLNTYDFGENMEYVPGYSYIESGKTYICVNVNHSLGDYIEILVDN